MSGQSGTSGWSRRAGMALLVGCALLLAGCATGYRYVQPNAGSGGYYTSSSVYSGAGYYDDYDTGPYFAGTSGWGYYNGSLPDAWVFGGYGAYGGWGYWPGINAGFGVSGIWNFPGYWGPWYSGSPPIWLGCHHRRCAHDQTNPGGIEHAQYLGVMSLRPSLPASGAPSLQTSRAVALPQDFGARGAAHWQRDRTAFEHARFVRAPAGTRGQATWRPEAALPAPEYSPRPLASPGQARSPVDFAQPRSNRYRASPRATAWPSSPPRARVPEVMPAPRPHDGHGPDIRRH